MNTIEAIKWISDNCKKFEPTYIIDNDNTDFYNKENEVISLLRQGEAYKTIFREITTNGYFSSIDTRYLLELEQKYSPRGDK